MECEHVFKVLDGKENYLICFKCGFKKKRTDGYYSRQYECEKCKEILNCKEELTEHSKQGHHTFKLKGSDLVLNVG